MQKEKNNNNHGTFCAGSGGFLSAMGTWDWCSRKYGTSSENFHEEHVTFTLNRLIITDKEKCAEEIIKKCRENDFASTLFSYDVAKPNALYGTVYRSRFSMKGQKPLFHFRYTQTADTLGSYNIVDDPEAFTLVIE